MKNLILMFVLLLVLNLSAIIINVPSEQPTIQEGINVAVNSDTVLVQPGDYQEMINYFGKNITVGSLFLTTSDSSYIDSTVIRYNINWNYVVTLANNESNEAKLIGFKIGQGGGSSKGVLCSNSSPQLMYNHIDLNGSYGIRCDSLSYALISNNLIENTDRGVQISYGASPNITNNLFDNVEKGVFVSSNSSAIIINNRIICSSTYPARGIETGVEATLFISGNSISNCNIGIQISNNSTAQIINNFIHDCSIGINCLENEVEIINNTIVNNEMKGIEILWDLQPVIINCIIWGNTVNVTSSTQAYFKNSCIENGIPINAINLGGNTSRNPCFIDSSNYQLSVYSPCVDAGVIDTTGLYLPEYDLAGNIRIQDGNGDNVLIVDMGSFEADTVTDPGFISGTITLLGGTGNVENVNVGVGAPVHPNENGEYLITIGTSASPYTVTAWLEGYLPQTFEDIEVLPGEITENIDFELGFYQPEEYLEFTPDSLQMITVPYSEFKIKNISLINVTISEIVFLSLYGNFHYEPYNLIFPYVIAPNDSLEFMIILDLPTHPENREFYYDSFLVISDVGTFTIPLTWNSEFINDIEENTISLTENNLFNHPNPFNPSTTIEFSLKNNSKVFLSIFNIKGQKIKNLVQNELIKGNHSIIWNGADESGKEVSSGIYYFKLNVNGKSETVKKCLLLK